MGVQANSIDFEATYYNSSEGQGWTIAITVGRTRQLDCGF
jgi:hypothetical protein